MKANLPVLRQTIIYIFKFCIETNDNRKSYIYLFVQTLYITKKKFVSQITHFYYTIRLCDKIQYFQKYQEKQIHILKVYI